MNLPDAIARLLAREDLSTAEMSDVMGLIMGGEASAAQIGAFLMGLAMKGETVTEVAAAAHVMRSLAKPVHIDTVGVVDIVGTGGDGARTFNVSTTASFVVAAAGGRVAKHGNRSVSSSSGSADVLEAIGVPLDLNPEQIARCVEEVGVGFMFAPMHHAAMKHAIAPRREMGVRTIFNVLGPLTNPAGVPNQLLGVFSPRWLEPLAEVLKRLGSRHVMVVHAEDGLDEISIAAPTRIAELRDGRISSYRLAPEDYGLVRAPLDAIRVDDPAASLAMMSGVLAGELGPARDIVLLNAGAALYVSGHATDVANGVLLAAKAIDSGAARARLDALARFTRQLVEERQG
ncbi:anthranilate phosphoribosyltransferase [Acidihalobacter yilgarnensis]|uniref:Anthranilate phosphoribosyltransferase n=1 Tax=Acidihalobacter yilgarnensis TaxID=2819280 RepID=A0A1D8IK88_9GAMM|nr:anthranilate phosphoribosyltransferase [Acidihalobacter yilgarnensis]AOU96883.1 anthranilate phosphoribosyltransferase [Acidihalobacter yilgarnensis]